MLTTKNNPGAFKKISKLTLRKMGSNGLARLKSGYLSSFTNGLRSDLNNYANQGKKKPRFYCNLCEKETPYFVNLSNRLRIKWHSACPNCNGRKRHRGLKICYEEILKDYTAPKVLHFAPEPVLAPIFDKEGIIYKTSDYLLEDVDYPKEDIQQLTFNDDSYDVVLCNHVIEHVPEDEKAMQELSRIITGDGVAVITIPGNMKRKNTIKFKDLSFNGHFRDYGIDVVEKLESYFNHVEVKDLYDYNNHYHLPLGLSPMADVAFICKNS